MTTPINRVSARDSAALQFESAQPPAESATESATESSPSAAEQPKSVDVSMGGAASDPVTLRVQSQDNQTHLFSFNDESHLRQFLNDEAGFDMASVPGASGKEALLAQVARSTDVTSAAFRSRRDGNIFAAENSPLPAGLKPPSVSALRGAANASGSTVEIQNFLIEQGTMEATHNGKSEADGLNGRRTRAGTLKYFAGKPAEYTRFYESLSGPEQGRLPAPGAEFDRIASDPETNQRAFNLPQARLAAFLRTPAAPEPEPVAETVPEPQAVPVGETVPEPQAVPVGETVPEPQAVPAGETVPEPQALPVHQAEPRVHVADATAVSGVLAPDEVREFLSKATDRNLPAAAWDDLMLSTATTLAASRPEAAAQTLLDIDHSDIAGALLVHTGDAEVAARIIRAFEPLGQKAIGQGLTAVTQDLVRGRLARVPSFDAGQLAAAVGAQFMVPIN